MNENRNTDPQAPDDDRILGDALGAAIGKRSESLDAIPPVDGVVERAAATASARRLRYTLVGVTAAAALLAGGLVAWSTLGRDGDGSVQVATPPPMLDRAEVAGPEPDPAAGQDAPDTDESDPAAARPTKSGEEEATLDEQLGNPVEADPDDGTGDAELGSAAPEHDLPAPEELSTGPTLTWTEVDPDTSPEFVTIYGIESVGDGRILARGIVPHYAWESPTDKVVVTTDGTSWTGIDTPGGVSPDFVDISGDLWLVAGPESGEFGPGGRPRVFVSDDEGAAWSELAIHLDATTPMPAHCLERSSVRAVLASGDRLVVVIESQLSLDLPELLVERGLAPGMESIIGWDHTADGLVVSLGDPTNPRTVEASYEELGIAPGQLPLCNAPDGSNGERVRLLLRDGTGAAQVVEYAGWVTSATGTIDGFSIIVTNRGSSLRVTSVDGRTWHQSPGGDSHLRSARGSGGTTWHSRMANGSYQILKSERGATPWTVATFTGLSPGGALAAGPAGITAAAERLGRAGVDDVSEHWFIDEPYELRLGQPVGGVSLWRPGEGSAIYTFDFEDLETNSLPDGVRMTSTEGGSTSLVFEDPQTGEHLVTFIINDLTGVIDRLVANSSRDAPERPDLRIGWSADGETWGWQDAADAFGIDADDWDLRVGLAVGEDFVLAEVSLVETDPYFTGRSELHTQPTRGSDELRLYRSLETRWFIAEVP